MKRYEKLKDILELLRKREDLGIAHTKMLMVKDGYNDDMTLEEATQLFEKAQKDFADWLNEEV